MLINTLGQARFPSPIRTTITDSALVPAEIIRQPGKPPKRPRV